MNQSATRKALRRGTPNGRVCSASTWVAPASSASRDRDRRRHPAVEVAPAADLDRRPARPGHPRRRPAARSTARPACASRRASSCSRSPRRRRRSAAPPPLSMHPLVPRRVEPGGEVEDLLDVDHRLAPHDLHRAHERARRERARSTAAAPCCAAPARKAAPLIAPAEAPTTTSKHGVSSEPLERRRHPGRHDAAHAAALEHERDPVRVAPRARPRAGQPPLPQHRRDGMRCFRHRPRP